MYGVTGWKGGRGQLVIIVSHFIPTVLMSTFLLPPVTFIVITATTINAGATLTGNREAS